MPYVEVYVDPATLSEFSVAELRTELEERARKEAPIGGSEITDAQLLEQIYYYFRNQASVPDCLREYLYRQIGRVL